MTHMWTVIYFEAKGEKATRVREICMGFGEDDESRRWNSAPTARDMPAQGNALGMRHHFKL